MIILVTDYKSKFNDENSQHIHLSYIFFSIILFKMNKNITEVRELTKLKIKIITFSFC